MANDRDFDERGFYEGRFINSRRFHHKGVKGLLRRVYLSFSIDTYEYRFFRRCLERKINKSSLNILDLGAGGGNDLLLHYGWVTAVDLSYTSVSQAVKLGYASAVVADARHLPFADNVFDLVTSSHFLGHVPLKDKEEVINEIFRVTKPGGFSMHSIEGDSNAWFYRKAKQSPELYRKYFVEMYGHFGLELPAANFERFKEVGFSPCYEEADPHKGYIRPIESYAVFFDNEYTEKSLVLGALALASRLLGSSRASRAAMNVMLGLLVPLAALFTPSDHRDSLKCLYRRPMMLPPHDSKALV